MKSYKKKGKPNGAKQTEHQGSFPIRARRREKEPQAGEIQEEEYNSGSGKGDRKKIRWGIK